MQTFETLEDSAVLVQLQLTVVGVKDRLTVEPKRRTERAKEAVTGLVARRVLGCNEGWLWLK